MLASAVLKQVADVAAPWQSFYSDSKAASAIVTFAHVGGMLVAGGLALAADRQTLRLAGESPDERRRHLAELASTHRPVIAMLVVVVLSGIAMFLADVEELGASAVYWGKMALFALLLVNGALMTRAEATLRGDEAAPVWGRLRAHAIVSGVLWLAVTLAGVLLQNG